MTLKRKGNFKSVVKPMFYFKNITFSRPVLYFDIDAKSATDFKITPSGSSSRKQPTELVKEKRR